ncbi:hypothetical protein ACH5RR_001199 [Cinchona calisaya]|uniref:Uncharacterized protein n=1 Tax=Cinchona calisaya TaxID=153742 RepID=A0ABD3B2V7_9GENT
MVVRIWWCERKSCRGDRAFGVGLMGEKGCSWAALEGAVGGFGRLGWLSVRDKDAIDAPAEVSWLSSSSVEVCNNSTEVSWLRNSPTKVYNSIAEACSSSAKGES